MKRSNGEGTIFKRNDGRWCAAYYDDEPVPKRHFVYGKTQKEVKQKLEEKKNNSKSTNRAEKNFTLQEWVQFYLETYKRTK